MPEVKSVSVRMSVDGYDDARLKIEKLSVAAEKLGKEHPEIVPTIDATKALLEARLLKAGIRKELAGSLDVGGGKLRGLLTSAAGGISGLLSGVPGIGGALGAAGSSPEGLAAILAAATAAAAALLVEAGALATGFAAATAGVGAFGLLAIPTFNKVKDAYTAINTAQLAYNQAVAVNKEDPTAAHAKAAAAALVKLHVAQEGVNGSTKTAVSGIQSLVGQFDKLAKAVQPTVMKVFNDGLRIANNLLPSLKPAAQAAGDAIDGLLKKADKFTKSQGFQDWLKHFTSLIGPSITAIGNGIGHVINAIGTLFNRFSKRDVTHAINIAFDTVVVSIRFVINAIGWLMTAWDKLQVAALVTAKFVVSAFKTMADGIMTAFAAPLHLLRTLSDAVGIHTFDSADNAVRAFKASVDKNLGGALKWVNDQLDHLAKVKVIPKVKADISNLLSQIASAKRALADHYLTKPAAAKVRADISELESKLRLARLELAALQDRTVHVVVAFSTTGRPTGYPHAASGGYRSGPTVVAEQGFEVIDLPPGSYVHNHQESQRMLSGASGGGNTYVTINAYVGHGTHPVQAAKEIAAVLNAGAASGVKLRKSILAAS